LDGAQEYARAASTLIELLRRETLVSSSTSSALIFTTIDSKTNAGSLSLSLSLVFHVRPKKKLLSTTQMTATYYQMKNNVTSYSPLRPACPFRPPGTARKRVVTYSASSGTAQPAAPAFIFFFLSSSHPLSCFVWSG
jgi:hypothetical protein